MVVVYGAHLERLLVNSVTFEVRRLAEDEKLCELKNCAPPEIQDRFMFMLGNFNIHATTRCSH